MTEMVQDKRGVYVIPPDYDEAEYEISEEQLIFEQFANEARDNDQYSKMTVSRVPMNRHGQRGAQKLSFLFEAGIDEYSYSQLLSKLRDEYGSGFYKIQARNEKGQLKLNKTVAVEAPAKETDKANADNGSGVIAQVSQTLAQQQSELRELMQANMRPQTDPIDTIIKISGAIAPILSALGLQRPEPPPPPKTLIEQLTEMKMVQELIGGDNGMTGEANLYSMLGEGLKAFGPAIAAAVANPQPDANPEKPRAQLEAPKPEPQTEDKKVRQDLKQQIKMILIQAKGGAEPEAIAQFVVDSVTAEQEDLLWENISADNCIPDMIVLVPEVAEHREWFDAFRDAIIELMADPENPDEISDDKDLQNESDGDSLVDTDHTSVDAVAGKDSDSHDPDDGDTPRDT